MAHVRTFEAFVEYLRTQQVPHQASTEARLVELASRTGPLPANILIKWEQGLPLIQLIQFMADQIPADRIPDLETAIIRVNNALPTPGFGFDHAQGRLYSRFIIPYVDADGIDPMVINRYSHVCLNNALDLFEAFQQVIGGAPGNTVIALHAASVAKRKAAAGTP